jgi:hypothetical protein
MTIIPEMMIKIPAILFTHFSPTKSSLFLKSIVLELSKKNHKHEPIKTPATRTAAEKNPSPSPKPNAAKTAIKAKIVRGLVSVRKTTVRYDLNLPRHWFKLRIFWLSTKSFYTQEKKKRSSNYSYPNALAIKRI